MVDITEKVETSRTAVAQSSILLTEEIYGKITSNTMKKGDVLAVAQVAGIMGAKQTADCHSNVSPACLKQCRY